MHALLRHLEDAGFAAAPRLVGSGLDTDGREVLTFIDGEFTQPGPWSLDGAAAVGRMLRDLHRATRSFRPPPDAEWFPWHGRDLGSAVKVFGHCDVAPWNIVARDGLPVALIDWETAGPVDPLVELAQLAWLNAKLHDDLVARLEHLPPLADRARQLAAIVDAYGLTARQRRGFLNQIIEFAICDAACRSRRRRRHPGDDRTPGRAMGDGLARPLRGLDDPPPPHPRGRPHQRSIVNRNGVSAGDVRSGSGYRGRGSCWPSRYGPHR